ncbi:RHS repeat domain-containing protein, partial [Shigella flexneri]|uniref:RHS repeat domain-containing protein n=1 Tax=Shigella flexneri TaxID=623 RepID=UPI0020967DB5
AAQRITLLLFIAHPALCALRRDDDRKPVRIQRKHPYQAVRALDDDHVWKADYNEHGQVIRETDPEGRVTRYGYDDQGLPET